MSPRRQPSPEDPAVLEVVAQAMRDLGWLIPQTPQQVLAWQQSAPDPTQAPPLPDLAGQASWEVTPLEAPLADDAAASLARAAREAGQLTEQAMRQMAADRQAAQQDLDDETDPPKTPNAPR